MFRITFNRPMLRSGSRGFTLTELIVTVSILAVIAAFAVPNMATMIQNNNRTSRLNMMVAAVTFARGHAVNNNTSVTVCESSDGVLCNNDPNAPNTGVFENGWIVFEDGVSDHADSVRDGVRHPHDDGTPANNERLLKVFGAFDGGASALSLQKADNSVLGFVTFNARGRPLGDARSAKFRICDSRGATSERRIEISATGQVATAPSTSSAALRCP